MVMAKKVLSCKKNNEDIKVIIKTTPEKGDWMEKPTRQGVFEGGHIGSAQPTGWYSHIDKIEDYVPVEKDIQNNLLYGSTVVESGTNKFDCADSENEIIIPLRDGMDITVNKSGTTVIVDSANDGKIGYAVKSKKFTKI